MHDCLTFSDTRLWPTHLYCRHSFMHSSFKVSPRHFLTALMSGPQLGHCKTLTVSFFSHYLVHLLLCLGALSCCMTQFRPSIGQMASHLTLEYFEIQRSLCQLNQCRLFQTQPPSHHHSIVMLNS